MKHLAAACLALVLAACVPHPPPLSPGMRALAADPPRDPAHPARNRQLVIPSGPVRPELGRPAEMNALFLLAAGEGPKPTLLLLHGLPGNERNLDLAQAVRRAGWHVLTFTYRGAWGSEGMFSLQHAMADAKAALMFLRSAEAANLYGVDASRIVIAGHSMGGAAAAVATAEDPPGDPPLAGLVLLDAWDIAATARRMKAGGAEGRARFVAGLDDLGRALGPIGAEDIADNVLRRGEDWDLAKLAPRLVRVPILSIYATHGAAEPNRALAEELRRQPGARVRGVELASDHAFADKRIALASELLRWLEDIAARRH
jgi:pimeloyl-ACP methyl ester carboxylesterase